MSGRRRSRARPRARPPSRRPASEPWHAPAARPGGRLRPDGLACLALVAVTAAVYLPTGGFGFVSYDDPQYVSGHARVRDGVSLEGARWALTGVHHGNWHPVTTLSWMLESQLGLGPGARHRVNAALHVANTLLLFWLLVRATGARWRSLAVAALFALHPLHVESVAWISSRKDLLSAGFGFAAMLAYVDWTRAGGPWRYVATLVLLGLGLASKATLVTWPFALLLLDVWPLERLADAHSLFGSWRTRLRHVILEKLPLLALSAGAILLTLWAQRTGGALKDTPLFPLGDRIANALSSYAVYLWRTLWPFDLAVLYPFPLEASVAAAIGSAALLAGVTFACVRLRSEHPHLLMGWLWYLGTLVPVIGLVQVGVQSSADRYTYLPLVGVFVAAVWGGGTLVVRRPSLRVAVVAAAGVASLLLAGQAARQVAVWRDSLTLYEHGLRVTGRNAVLANNLGIALADLGRHDEAVAAYERGLGFPSPVTTIVHYNAGISVAHTGRHTAAIGHFDRVLRADPGHAEALYHRAASLEALGRLDQARRDLERVVALEPGEADPRLELGLVLGKLGDLDGAVVQLARAVELRPGNLDARINLGIARLKQGDAAAAVAELEHVLELAPGHEAAARYLELAHARRPVDPEP